MTNISTKDFCREFRACADGTRFARKFETMREWDAASDARDAAWDAACDAARDAASDAELREQLAILATFGNPFAEVTECRR